MQRTCFLFDPREVHVSVGLCYEASSKTKDVAPVIVSPEQHAGKAGNFSRYGKGISVSYKKKRYPWS